jgi:hypothetical protein
MSGPLTKTIWPELPVPNAIKTWLGTLFTLVDSKDSDAPRLVAALYAEDAVVYGMAGKATGKSGLFNYFFTLVLVSCNSNRGNMRREK